MVLQDAGLSGDSYRWFFDPPTLRSQMKQIHKKKILMNTKLEGFLVFLLVLFTLILKCA